MEKSKWVKTLFRAILEGDEYIESEPIIGYEMFRKLQITNIEVKIDKIITITVTLERPGLLIGKAGRTIDELTERLSKRLNDKVEIIIKDSEIWN